MLRERSWLWLPSACALWTFVEQTRLFLSQSRYFIDDPFISMRYAAHLIRYGELSFNAGQLVEGYSNFLHVLMHASLFMLAGGPLPSADAIDRAVLLCVLAALLQVVLLYVMAARAHEPTHRLSWYAAAVFSLGSWPFAYWAVTGLETPFEGLLYVATCVAVSALEQDASSARKLSVLALMLGAIVLLRFEGAVVAAMVAAGVASWLRQTEKRSRATALLLTVGAIIVSYHGWRLHYFGRLLPNTYVAKATGDATAVRVIGGFVYALYWLQGILGLGAMLIGAAYLGKSRVSLRAHLRFLRGRPTELTIWTLIATKLALVAWGGGDWMPGSRMLLCVSPFALYLSVRTLLTLLRRQRGPGAHGSLIAAALLCVAVLMLARIPHQNFPALDGSQESGGLRKLPTGYLEMGSYLERYLGGSTREVAVGEAGLIPYQAARVRFMDLFGLVDRDMALQPGGMHARVHVDHVLQRAPQAVVFAHLHRAAPFSEYQYGRELLGSPKFHAAYERAEVGERLDSWGWAVYQLRGDAVLPRRRGDPLLPH